MQKIATVHGDSLQNVHYNSTNSYTHIMEVTGDKFKISTTMDVRIPPDEWNIQGREVFTSKIMVNLMSIESTRTEISKGPGFA